MSQKYYKKPLISIVLGSYNRKSFLKETIKSIREQKIDVEYEVIVIDGGSSDGSIDYLLKQKDVITIIQHNRGKWRGKSIVRKNWGYFMNIAFKASHGKYVLMLSDDCLLLPDSIMNGYNLFERENSKNKRKIGAVAFYFRNYPIDPYYYVLYTFKHKMFVNHGMFLKKALEDVGYIDEDNYQFYYADGDLCAKMWEQGYQVIDSPTSIVEHFFHANEHVRESNYLHKSQNFKTFKKKWEGIFYTKETYSKRGKRYISFLDKKDTVKIFRKIYRKKYDFYKGLIKYYTKRSEKRSVKVSCNKKGAILVYSKNQILLCRDKKKTSSKWEYPLDKIQKDISFENANKHLIKKYVELVNLRYEGVIGQSGLTPEEETYFFKYTSEKDIDYNQKDAENEWRWFHQDKLPKYLDKNHIPFIEMGFN